MAELSHLDALESLLDEGRLVRDRDLLTTVSTSMRGGSGSALFSVEAGNTHELSTIARWAHDSRSRLIVQGANTGLVGASTPDDTNSQGVLRMARMNQILDLSVVERTVVVEAGVLLDDLNAELAAHGLFVPIDLGSNPSIGGLIATNAGGTGTIRYGDMRRQVLGVEAVIADKHGSVIGSLTRLRKDNSRLGISRLFIGSFGALGVVSRAVLRLASIPNGRATALLAISSDAAALNCLSALRVDFPETLSAFEYISTSAINLTMDNVHGLRRPYAQLNHGGYLLVEVSDSRDSPDVELELAEALGRVQERHAGDLVDAVIGSPEHLWKLRHSLSEGVRGDGSTLRFDISVPISRLPDLGARIRALFANQGESPMVCQFGHWGDGGTHLQIVYPGNTVPNDEDSIRRSVYEVVVRELGGSFSSEHGLGPHNAKYYEEYVPSIEREYAKQLKLVMDPRHVWGRAPF